jgi:hypothetical protein
MRVLYARLAQSVRLSLNVHSLSAARVLQNGNDGEIFTCFASAAAMALLGMARVGDDSRAVAKFAIESLD